jgi:predicted Zn-dependent peptidase
VNLARLRDIGPAVADRVATRLVYGDAHPYGRSDTEASIKAITRDDLVAFHQQYFKPGRAIVTVAGDVSPAEARRVIEQAFAQWPAGGERPAFTYPATPTPKATTIYVVDKPNAPQSSIVIALAGPPRATPDYYALALLNTILGGPTPQSRLNMNLREEKGYSYGVRSNFAYGRGPGPFRASGEVTGTKTDSSLIEFMKELKGAQGGRPFTDEEVARGKRSLIQSLPRQFGSLQGVAGSITYLYANDLPETYWQDYARNVESLTSADLERVAKQYLDLDHLAIVIVGDRAKIESTLAATKIAPVVDLDANGDPVAAAATTGGTR